MAAFLNLSPLIAESLAAGGRDNQIFRNRLQYVVALFFRKDLLMQNVVHAALQPFVVSPCGVFNAFFILTSKILPQIWHHSKTNMLNAYGS